jgi:voltage-gated potassium channel
MAQAPDPVLTELRNRIGLFVLVLLVIAAVGMIGYMVLEHWTAMESLYMTVITLSTVGFKEVRPLGPAGEAFTIGLIVAGVGAVGYFFKSVGQSLVSGEVAARMRRRRMQDRVDALSGHYIICGFGRVGRQVAQDLMAKGKACVAVDPQPIALAGIAGTIPYVIGDAADDEILKQAGIERAAGLVISTGEDPTNLFVTLSAHALNPQLVIVARANDDATEPKLRRAGANHVISPYAISGRRIATQLLFPTLTDFLDVVLHSGKLELWLEECQVTAQSELEGRTVAEADVRRRTGANVLAVRRHGDGGILTNPPAQLRFEPGDVLIAFGTREQLGALHRAAGETTGVKR